LGGYAYPDPTDEITAAMISNVVAEADYWRLSEQQALAVVERALKGWVADRRARLAVDVGTGFGRLLPWLATCAERIVATDPDERRLAGAVRAASQMNNVEFAELDAVAASVADLILCSHIIQHVPLAVQDTLFANISRVATDRAALVVSYAQATSGDRYVVESIKHGEHHVDEIDETSFNEYATNPGRADGEILLPIRYVDSESVERALSRRGWYEVLRWEHHIDAARFEATIVDDLVVNSQIHDVAIRGRDVMSIFKKTA
jgi:SAM-dependent methyltransferase